MEMKPIKNLNATVKLPGSKSYTQRALVIAALAEGRSSLRSALVSDDTKYLMAALQSLGAGIVVQGEDIIVVGTGGRISNPGREIFLGNNGTALRFLTTLVALGRGRYTLTGDLRLRERPVKPLLDALRSTGIDVNGTDGDFPPIVTNAAGLPGGKTILKNPESSQYISSLLISAPYAATDTVVEIQGSIPSLPYVDMTIETMKTFGVTAEKETSNRYRVAGGTSYRATRYRVEGDISSASYFFLAAALCKGTVRVENVNPRSLQGDIGFLEILEDVGCHARRGETFVEVAGGPWKEGPLVFDLGGMPDMVPTLAVLASLRPGRTVIRGAAHLRFKESNRLAALSTELNRVAVRAEEREDGLVIDGGIPRGAVIETYNDHRIAMSFAVLGLAVPGIRIRDRECVNKSFPGFWEELEKL
jgi:3-phosphoshikimate 1-carboxyvinyltransferase